MGDKKVFKVLAIDGGGIKGLFASTILERIERDYNLSISDHFDMICGTSTGGLIALGLALKIPANELSRFYVEKGPEIFKSGWPWARRLADSYKLIRQIGYRGKYSDKALRKALEGVFEEKRIADLNNLVCIPSYTITEGRPWVFKRDYGIKNRDNNTLLVDVALATSAAPTYFPVAQISSYDNSQFIDGGVWANNPSLVGYLEAVDGFVGKSIEKEYDELMLLSIGNPSKQTGESTSKKRYRSFISWRDDLFETSMNGQNFFTNYFLERLAEHTNIPFVYHRLDASGMSAKHEELIGLDKATKSALDLLRVKAKNLADLELKKEETKQFFKEPKTYLV